MCTKSQLSSWKGIALALRNIASTDSIGGTEDGPHHDFGERGLSDFDDDGIKQISRSLEKLAKEVNVEDVSAGVCVRALWLSY